MKKIFSYNADINKTAYLNWRMNASDTAHNLAIMAESFSTAAFIMIDAILSDNSDKKADILIFSILYSIDQAIELHLKSILRELESLANIEPSNYKTHDINSLFQNMLAQITRKEAQSADLKKYLQEIDEYIQELYDHITGTKMTNPKLDFARYPIDTSGNDHFYISLDNTVVDVENLKERFKKMNDSLASIFAMYQNELEENSCPD